MRPYRSGGPAKTVTPRYGCAQARRVPRTWRSQTERWQCARAVQLHAKVSQLEAEGLDMPGSDTGGRWWTCSEKGDKVRAAHTLLRTHQSWSAHLAAV